MKIEDLRDPESKSQKAKIGDLIQIGTGIYIVATSCSTVDKYKLVSISGKYPLVLRSGSNAYHRFEMEDYIIIAKAGTFKIVIGGDGNE